MSFDQYSLILIYTLSWNFFWYILFGLLIFLSILGFGQKHKRWSHYLSTLMPSPVVIDDCFQELADVQSISRIWPVAFSMPTSGSKLQAIAQHPVKILQDLPYILAAIWRFLVNTIWLWQEVSQSMFFYLHCFVFALQLSVGLFTPCQ